MKKIILSLNKLSKMIDQHKKNGESVGLVLGGFDILHMGHVNLFRLAKKHTGILVVGLDSDQTLKMNKGPNRPINNFRLRSQLLSEIDLIDYIFKIDKKIVFSDSENNYKYFLKLYKKIKPTHVFTHPQTDVFWNKRSAISKELGIKFVPDKTKYVTSTTEIVKKLIQKQ